MTRPVVATCSGPGGSGPQGFTHRTGTQMHERRPTRPSPRRGARWGRYAVRARRVGGLALVGLLVAAPAASANGIDVRSSSRYVLQAKQELVRATMTITVRNLSPSIRTGNYIQYYYVPYFRVPIPADAQQLTATSNGATLSVSRTATKDPSTAIAKISFPSNLLYGQSRKITMRFVLKGEKPRSKDQTRVGPGYATFAVFGDGNPGQMKVEVVLPSSMTFDASTDLFSHKESGGTTTYTATKNTESAGFWAVVSARDPAISASDKVDVSGQSVDVRAYQDDPTWLTFVSSRMTKGVPVLEKLIGTPWPGGLTTVREDRSVNVRGYDGWFDTSSDEIVIGEQLDQELLFHELTHAWATPDTLGERWIYEGVAQQLAAEAVTELGGKPRAMTSVSRSSSDALPLDSWTADAGGRAQTTDEYGYPASYKVVKTLLAGCADGTQSKVLAAAVAGDSAYAAPNEHWLTGYTDWGRFLDLLQSVGKNDSAAKTYSTWVLTPAQRKLLAPREKARTAYAAVDAADGDFVPPIGLRRSMTKWDFASAERSIAAVKDLGPAAVQVQEAAKRNNMAIPDKVAALYEGADGVAAYQELATTLPKAAKAIDAVGAADRAAAAPRNPLSALGAALLGVDAKAARADSMLDRADLDRAMSAADDTTSVARWATWLGLGLLIGALVVLTALALTVSFVLRRRSRRRVARAAAQAAAAAGAAEAAELAQTGAPAAPWPSTPPADGVTEEG